MGKGIVSRNDSHFEPASFLVLSHKLPATSGTGEREQIRRKEEEREGWRTLEGKDRKDWVLGEYGFL